ncbi:hypothetical protein HYDPIDRAFT_117970 [Hydnomerulius pinastri MD-312]|uniref:Uncharacterized protein n=1 Tax=Hydnomerulius pinastri MD-312 TaxID=994086 RepID=A0A0C9W9Z3_9AGAM|nr:hypothetical protein HYDPIDRAFT_117970 [Hydnomerulius pinastri MD-312]
MAEYTPIPAFKGQLIFTTAYTYTKAKIHEFLDGVANDPAKYGAPVDRKAHFELLRTCIKDLDFPDGKIYKQDEPKQQILRKLNQVLLDPTIPILWIRKQQPYFIIFDLLGVFLSLMGPAPSNATAKNYYLPLVVIYSKWCTLISPETNQSPTITQITWTKEKDQFYPFLGASSRGYAYGTEGPPAAWTALVQTTRHGYIKGSGVLPAKYQNFGTSPGIEQDAVNGTNFGNCAETYPFLYILADKTLPINNAFGIAFKTAKVTAPAYNGATFWHKRKGGRLPPCINCKDLIKYFGGTDDTIKNFDLA